MGAEGREAGLDRLMVTDIGKDPGETREHGALPHRRHHAALRHRRQEADGLEQHRLAAGVGTAHHHRPLLRRE